MYICVCVVGVMKFGNIVPRAGLEPTPLVRRIIIHVMLYMYIYIYMGVWVPWV